MEINRNGDELEWSCVFKNKSWKIPELCVTDYHYISVLHSLIQKKTKTFPSSPSCNCCNCLFRDANLSWYILQQNQAHNYSKPLPLSGRQAVTRTIIFTKGTPTTIDNSTVSLMTKYSLLFDFHIVILVMLCQVCFAGIFCIWKEARQTHFLEEHFEPVSLADLRRAVSTWKLHSLGHPRWPTSPVVHKCSVTLAATPTTWLDSRQLWGSSNVILPHMFAHLIVHSQGDMDVYPETYLTQIATTGTE